MNLEPTDLDCGEHIGYLVVGHGTRQVTGQEQLRQVAQQLARIMAPAPVASAFLELARPSIVEGVQELARRGVSQFVTIPVLLFTAGHALDDIPQGVQRAAQELGLINLGQSNSLELHPAIIRLSALRFYGTLGNKGISHSVGLAMIGRGSSSVDATEKMLQFVSQRFQAVPVQFSTVGFVAVQKPTVCDALDQLESSDCEILVVQPHLLFEGILVQQIREAVSLRQSKSSRTWLVTPTLGSDESLALALAEVAREVTFRS